MAAHFEANEVNPMSPTVKEVKRDAQYRIESKRVTGVALYQNSVAGISVVPVVEGKPVSTSKLLALVEVVHPSHFVEIKVGDDVLASGFDFGDVKHDWKAIATAEFKKYSARKATEVKAKQAQETAVAERRAALIKFIEATKHEPFNFANELLFQTPNAQVANKVRDLFPSAFIDVAFDDSNRRWSRFADPDEKIRDSICPSCGGGDIVAIRDSSTGLIYRVCHSQHCNFRWADKPHRCPVCQYGKLELEMDGSEAYIACGNRQNCRYNAKLGRLPRVPAHEDEPALETSAGLGTDV
jgi:hypothetical protein